jgi:SAM-dependent methyltransferase
MGIKTFLLSREPFKPVHMGHWTRTAYFKKYAFPLLRRNTHAELLDAGCGTGTYSRLVAGAFPSVRIRALDIAPFKEWRDAPQNVLFGTQDLRSFSEIERYDVIVSVDVLEHVPNNADVIRRLTAALRTDGYLYVAIPSESEEQRFLPRRFLHRFYEWEGDEHVGEQRTLSELVFLIESIGLEVVVARHTFTFFGMLAWEVEMALHWHASVWAHRSRIVLMPLLKTLALLDVLIPLGTGNNLIVARKI